MIELFQQKTDIELETISKDYAFYSEEERLIALNELGKRMRLSDELIDLKMVIEDSGITVPIAAIDKPPHKIYTEKAIWTGTFLGGPLAAGYFIAENFKTFQEAGRAKKTWVYAIVASVLIFSGIFFIPENIKIPNMLIPFIYTSIAAFFVQYFQHRNIFTHTASGGKSYSWGRTICVGLIGAAISFTFLFGIALFVTTAQVSTKTYGLMEHTIGFDKSNITESEVDKLAEGLTKVTFFDGVQTKYVYAEKKEGRYELSISVVDGVAQNAQALQSFIELRNELQTLFPDNKIVLKLVVDHLDRVIKRIE